MLRPPETITCWSKAQTLQRETETGCFGLRPVAQSDALVSNPFNGDGADARRDAVDESGSETARAAVDAAPGPKSCQPIHWRGRARRGVRRRDPGAPPPSTAA